VDTIIGTFHFFFTHSCILQKESCYTSASAANLDFNNQLPINHPVASLKNVTEGGDILGNVAS
jgi:hypothetical protein